MRLLVGVCMMSSLWAAGIGPLRDQFKTPPGDSRIMMRWWWFGPAVTRAGIEREMRTMREGGIGGFEVQPVYPMALDDPSRRFRNLEFMSPEFMQMLRFTGTKARQMGMRFDLTLGSGWPYGGPSVPVTQAAGRLKVVRVKTGEPGRIVAPDLGNGEQFVAAYGVKAGKYDKLGEPAQGVLKLPPGAAYDEVVFFISSRTGMMVKRPAVGAEGFVIDHYDRSALDGYLKRIGSPMLDGLGGQMPYAIFADSMEVFGSDWTPAFAAEFQKRRGYDLIPLLPSLLGDVDGDSEAVRQDWGKTLTELFDERFMAPMQQFARTHGTKFRVQGYGIPPATISSNYYADISEGEGVDWKQVRAARWASSANHLFGRTVTTSETWTWLHSPSFRATPLDMKAEADIHFLQGVNQLIGHGWPYTPEAEPYPGWRFYAAAVFDESNPWWIAMPDVAKYLQRVSFMMRQGRAANDVALYLPNDDAYGAFRAGRVHMIETLRALLGKTVMPQILEAGYGLDFVDDGAMAKGAKVEGGKLLIGGNPYGVVVLPGVRSIPLQTLRTLNDFVRSGGVLVAARRLPERAPGLKPSVADQAEVKRIVDELFNSPGAKGVFVEVEGQLGERLRAAFPPDMKLMESVPEIGFVRRSLQDAEVYFIANTSNLAKKVKAEFRQRNAKAEWFDPMTGESAGAVVKAGASGRTVVELDLPAYGSRILVFSSQARTGIVQAPPARVAELGQEWTVRFADGQPKAAKLGSWTMDEETKYFSGVASYSTKVELKMEDARRAAWLDFGGGRAWNQGGPQTEVASRNGMLALVDAPVREAAVVVVNGKRAGAVWCPPYRVAVTGLLKAGVNEIEIRVANTAINHMAGRALPDYRLLNTRYGTRFEPQDMDKVKPVDSGLMAWPRLLIGGN